MQQEVYGHVWGATEFATERPFRPSATDQKPAIDPRSRRGARKLFKLGNAVEGEEIDAPSMSVRDFCFALDGVPERQAFGADTQRLAAVNLAGAREVEIAAEFRESGNDFRRRVGLDRVKDRRVRKDGAERRRDLLPNPPSRCLAEVTGLASEGRVMGKAEGDLQQQVSPPRRAND